MTAAFNRVGSILKLAPVVPVITIDDAADAAPLARALVAGGLKALEITLRTGAALEAIAAVAAEVPDAVVGAGTVLNAAQMEQVAEAGGKFCVAPGATIDILEAASETGMKLLPGAVTPSEVMSLLEMGITYMKFFPAEAAGGVAVLKAYAAPLADAIFCPTGGITEASAMEWLKLPNVACVGGTWICPKDLIAAGDWDEITRRATAASKLKG